VIEDEIASSVVGDVPPTRDPSIYALWVQMTKGHTAAEAEAVIEPELLRLTSEAVPAAELDKARAQLETAFWRGLTSSEGRAEQLGEFEVCAGDYRKLLERASEYGKVTAEDLTRVAASYFARARGPSSWPSPSPSDADSLGSLLVMASLSTLALGATRSRGPAGSIIIVDESHVVPIVHVEVAARSGSPAIPARGGPHQPGRRAGRRGAGGRSRAEMDEALDALGARIDAIVDADSVRLQGTCWPGTSSPS
jgi:predicted Zn-dependent peptidase